MNVITKKTVTESERNAIFTTLTPDEFHLFECSLSSLLAEYRNENTLKLSSLVPILGNPPKIPQSPDMDAMLEAWEEKAEYGKKANSIEDFIAYEVARMNKLS